MPIFPIPIVMLIVHQGPIVDRSIRHGQCDELIFTWMFFTELHFTVRNVAAR